MENEPCFICGGDTEGGYGFRKPACDDCREEKSHPCSECLNYVFPTDGVFYRKNGDDENFCCSACFSSLKDYDEIRFSGETKWYPRGEIFDMMLLQFEKK